MIEQEAQEGQYRSTDRQRAGQPTSYLQNSLKCEPDLPLTKNKIQSKLKQYWIINIASEVVTRLSNQEAADLLN